MAPGQDIAVLDSDERTEVEMAVPESLISELKTGAAAEVQFDALPDVSLAATVTEVGVATSRSAGAYPVVVTLGEADPRVRSGMSASVTVQLGHEGEQPHVFVTPRAVGEDRRGRFAYVAQPTEPGFAQVERREVQVGDVTSRGLAILEGVNPGELVVTAGVRHLSDGLEVKLPETTRAPTAVPSAWSREA